MKYLNKLICEGNGSTIRSHLRKLCSFMNFEPHFIDNACHIPMGNGLNLLVDFSPGKDGGFIFILPLLPETILYSKKVMDLLVKRNEGLIEMEWREVKETGIIIYTDLPFTITLDDFSKTIGRLVHERSEALKIPVIEEECLLFAEEIEEASFGANQ